jgi:hypothetical protein
MSTGAANQSNENLSTFPLWKQLSVKLGDLPMCPDLQCLRRYASCHSGGFVHLLAAGFGPKRQFAAAQRYGRCRWNTGRSVDAADTAADP